MAREQIGTVEITRVRIYNLDPQAREDLVATTVVVQPGTYPVYQDGDTRYWRMTGTINRNHVWLGDGAGMIQSGDVPGDDDVVFYSRRFGPDEWAALMVDTAEVQPQRLIFRIAGEQ